MHIVFVCYYGFGCNSAGQIACLSNALVQRGVQVTVFVPFASNTAAQHGPVNYACRQFDELECWHREQQPDPWQTLIVAWTPRENVRQFVQQLQTLLPCSYLVHLEDNEELITATNLGLTIDELKHLPSAELDQRLQADDRLSHPHHFPAFIAASAGITVLAEPLREFAPPDHPHCVFWPGYNPVFFGSHPIDYPGRRALGITDDTIVLVYPGNVHRVNVAEVRSLYLATCILNRQGIKTLLVRTGEDNVPVLDHTLHEAACHFVSLGKLASQSDVAATLALADFLVQPGHPGPFNDYRFPSKLPEFFSIGRPVLLPASNPGRHLRSGHDAVVLKRGDALDIATELRKLIKSPESRERLSLNAREFAQTHFQWKEIAGSLTHFYKRFLPHPH